MNWAELSSLIVSPQHSLHALCSLIFSADLLQPWTVSVDLYAASSSVPPSCTRVEWMRLSFFGILVHLHSPEFSYDSALSDDTSALSLSNLISTNRNENVWKFLRSGWHLSPIVLRAFRFVITSQRCNMCTCCGCRESHMWSKTTVQFAIPTATISSSAPCALVICGENNTWKKVRSDEENTGKHRSNQPTKNWHACHGNVCLELGSMNLYGLVAVFTRDCP